MAAKKGMPRTHGPKCGANTKHGPCGNPAGYGTNHKGFGTCHRHGGRTPGMEKHARKLMIEDAAQKFGVEVETTAEEALLGALRRATGYVLYYRERCAELSRDAHIQGTERIIREAKPNPNGPGDLITDTTIAKTVQNEYLRLLAYWENQQFRVAAKIAELQIEVGKVRLLQEQAELFYDGMIKTLELFGISRDDERIPDIIPRVMGEIVG